jgi:ABC-2 type transport system permease protein
MNGMISSLSAELLKMRRSKIFLLTLAISVMIPLMCAFMMWIVMHPELATNLNLVKAKADILVARADWPSFLVILYMMAAMGGIIIFGFATSWIFGREYTDRTVKDILALPVSRDSIVLSKFIAVIFWCALLSAAMLFSGLISGLAIGLPGWSPRLLPHAVKIFFVTSALTILLSFPVGFFASAGRGYLPPLGFIIFMIALAQFIAHLGWGAYFPWSIPAFCTGVVGPAEGQIGVASIIIMLLTAAGGLAATVLWWRFADQK